MIDVQIDARALERLQKVGASVPAACATIVRRLLVRAGDLVSLEIRSGPPKTRSGRLALSWSVGRGDASVDVQQTSGGADGRLRSSSRYARIQNSGGTVTPTSARMLAIPLAAAKTAAGVSRYSSPRQVGDLALRRSRAGRLLLVKLADAARPARAAGLSRARSRTGIIPPVPPGAVPYFLLVDRVTIPASHYVDRAGEKLRGEAAEVAGEVVRQAIRETA